MAFNFEPKRISSPASLVFTEFQDIKTWTEWNTSIIDAEVISQPAEVPNLTGTARKDSGMNSWFRNKKHLDNPTFTKTLQEGTVLSLKTIDDPSKLTNTTSSNCTITHLSSPTVTEEPAGFSPFTPGSPFEHERSPFTPLNQVEEPESTMLPSSSVAAGTPLSPSSSRRESVAPQSRRESVVPQSRRESIVPPSRRESVVPPSDRSSVLSLSHRWSASTAPTSVSTMSKRNSLDTTSDYIISYTLTPLSTSATSRVLFDHPSTIQYTHIITPLTSTTCQFVTLPPVSSSSSTSCNTSPRISRSSRRSSLFFRLSISSSSSLSTRDPGPSIPPWISSLARDLGGHCVRKVQQQRSTEQTVGRRLLESVPAERIVDGCEQEGEAGREETMWEEEEDGTWAFDE